MRVRITSRCNNNSNNNNNKKKKNGYYCSILRNITTVTTTFVVVVTYSVLLCWMNHFSVIRNVNAFTIPTTSTTAIQQQHQQLSFSKTVITSTITRSIQQQQQQNQHQRQSNNSIRNQRRSIVPSSLFAKSLSRSSSSSSNSQPDSNVNNNDIPNELDDSFQLGIPDEEELVDSSSSSIRKSSSNTQHNNNNKIVNKNDKKKNDFTIIRPLDVQQRSSNNNNNNGRTPPPPPSSQGIKVEKNYNNNNNSKKISSNALMKQIFSRQSDGVDLSTPPTTTTTSNNNNKSIMKSNNNNNNNTNSKKNSEKEKSYAQLKKQIFSRQSIGVDKSSSSISKDNNKIHVEELNLLQEQEQQQQQEVGVVVGVQEVQEEEDQKQGIFMDPNAFNAVMPSFSNTNTNVAIEEEIEAQTEEDEWQTIEDIEYMKIAIAIAQEDGGERGKHSAYPNPTVGAVLVSVDEQSGESYIIGQGRSDYKTDAIRACIESIDGISVEPLQEWTVSWAGVDPATHRAIQKSTLYVTLEPSPRRFGTSSPPITSLIQEVGIPRIVIGCPDPVPENEFDGAIALHNAGIQVVSNLLYNHPDQDLLDSCQKCIEEYAMRANSKLQRMARKHFEQFGRPLGFLHCSVVGSDDVRAFARHGNAFGTNCGGTVLGFRNRGAYEFAPPPDVIWADDEDESNSGTDSTGIGMMDVEFEEENYQGDMPTGNPMMPWYEQVDAIVVTFPRQGDGPKDDDSLTARLRGLTWMATHGDELPAGVERILVMDATDLPDLPLTNKDPNLPKNVDIEAFWKGEGRKPTRILLRRGLNEAARAAAASAAAAAAAANTAAQEASAAIESGDAERAAQAALECQKTAENSLKFIQEELSRTKEIRRVLEVEYSVVLEAIDGCEPIDVMKHLGERNGMHSLVWRAGCWGQRGVRAILEGAFQWVSAHLAVDAIGGRFWQLMIAENAVQAACGPESRIKVFADQEDISLEYCDQPDVDEDCVLTVQGRPVRHVRLDCRVALVDEDRPREFDLGNIQKITRKIITEEAPWFI